MKEGTHLDEPSNDKDTRCVALFGIPNLLCCGESLLRRHLRPSHVHHVLLCIGVCYPLSVMRVIVPPRHSEEGRPDGVQKVIAEEDVCKI